MTVFIESSGYEVLTTAADNDATTDPLTRKLRAFAGLPVGWSHGEGLPVTEEAIGRAEEFIRMALQLQLKADVFPGFAGDCSVAFYQGDRSVEVIVRPGSAEFGLHVERGIGLTYETVYEKEDASWNETVGRITELVLEAWKSRESSPSVSSILGSVDSLTSCLSILQDPATTLQMAN